MKYTQIRANTFEELQLNAGILLSDFNPSTASFENDDILGATSGGVSFTDAPTYTDFAENIDNAPKNMKEMKRIDSRAITISGTFITVNTERAKSLIAACDIDSGDETHIVPRDELHNGDFSDIWWVGDYSDKNGTTNGGYIAIHLMNALSTGGFSLQSGDRSKGQFAFTYMAHYSMENPEQVPYEMFIKAGSDE